MRSFDVRKSDLNYDDYLLIAETNMALPHTRDQYRSLVNNIN